MTFSPHDSEPAPQRFWSPRATFKVSKSRRQREAQYRQQINVLIFVVLAALIGGGIIVLINYQNAGSSKQVNCTNYPQYCVPLAGESANPILHNTESASMRQIDGDSHAAPGVVRGIVDDTVPFIGDPAAPVEFTIIAAFSCGHCQTFHTGDLERVIEDIALEGKAVVRSLLLPRNQADLNATEAAFCAGEQGAYWEMADELFRLASSMHYDQAFTDARIAEAADDIGLDANKISACLASERYQAVIETNMTFASDNGVTGTPTILVRRAGESAWTVMSDRGFDDFAALLPQD